MKATFYHIFHVAEFSSSYIFSMLSRTHNPIAIVISEASNTHIHQTIIANIREYTSAVCAFNNNEYCA